MVQRWRILTQIGIHFSHCVKMQALRSVLPERFQKFFQHPSFWPGFAHTEGDYGFNFQFKADNGQVVPFETTQLNVTDSKDGLVFDYTYVTTEDPPQFQYFDFEVYDWKAWGVYGTTNWHLPVVVGIVYVIAIFGIERWMRDRPAYKLKWPLFLWNTALGIFSIIGFIRTVPEFVHILMGESGFYKAICYRCAENMRFWASILLINIWKSTTGAKYTELP